jgi:ankyrin repeat protein
MDTPAAPPQVMVVLKTKQEGIFELPINVALQRNASLDVLRLLVQVGPDVLTEPDGPEQWCSLAHALCKKRKFDVIQLLVQANPDCCKIQDRRSNFPLHIACCVGSSLAVVKLIGSQYPEATKAKNFNGQTPLDICQRNVLCSDAVIDYLQNTEFDGLEDNAVHLDFDDDEYVGSAR